MQSLKYWLAIGLVSSVVVTVLGCQNQLAHAEPDGSVADADWFEYLAADSPAALLRPVNFSLLIYSGSSGALLPENIDTQLLPLLEKFDDWQQIAKITIVGHTDAEGSGSSNLKLSRLRAQAVADTLMASGVAFDTLVIEGRGETSPVADNASLAGKQLNRRVEVHAEGFDQLDSVESYGYQSIHY